MARITGNIAKRGKDDTLKNC